MAQYKIVDSGKLDGDLTLLADAIRERASTSGRLVFPEGMAETIKNIPEGVQLPVLGEKAAAASDMAADKVLYDDQGDPVTGTLPEVSGFLGLSRTPESVTFSPASNEIHITSGMYTPLDFIGRSTLKFRTRVPAGQFGDAQPEQVARGATFTSGAGLLMEGTLEPGGGMDVSIEGETLVFAEGGTPAIEKETLIL